MMSRLNDISMKASGVCAGVAFFGGMKSNFQLIIKCPIHIYTVIKKKLSGSNHDMESHFFTGSIEIEDLVLPQYKGVFIYRSDKGKVKKYNAAFVYPLMADYMVSPDEYAKLQSLVALLSLANYEYYDKLNRSVSQILNVFQLPGEVTIEGFDGAFCCLQADKSE